MCKCKDTQGFNDKLKLAQLFEKETGKTQVVFVLNEIVFVCGLNDLHDELGICCYFLSDGTEVIYRPSTQVVEAKNTKSKIKTAKNDIQEVQPAPNSQL
jgi:hypothetical protein